MKKKTVLLADDVKLFLELEKTFLRREGVEILTAGTGREALQAARDRKPDLVLMDLFMPEMNGDEACRELKDDPSTAGIPVVMVTFGGREEDLERCRRAGCDEILLKPINGPELLAVVRRSLDISERREARIPARLEVRSGSDQGSLVTHYTVNVSSGGFFLEMETPLEAETPLTLEFFLPERPKSIRCRARVAWANPPGDLRKADLPPGVGIQFLDLSLDDMYAVRDFVRKQPISPSW